MKFVALLCQNLAGQFDKIVNLPKVFIFSSEISFLTMKQPNTYIGAALSFEKAVIEQFILPDHPARYTDRFRNLRLATNKIQAQGIKFLLSKRYRQLSWQFLTGKMKIRKIFREWQISFLIFIFQNKKPRTKGFLLFPFEISLIIWNLLLQISLFTLWNRIMIL